MKYLGRQADGSNAKENNYHEKSNSIVAGNEYNIEKAFDGIS